MHASFDRVSWFYDPLARLTFGGAIQKSQVTLLSFIPAEASVLLVGGGTGWLLRDFARLSIPLNITYLELSPRMLNTAKKTLASIPSHLLQVDFRQGNETNISAHEIFDIILTPFVLDLYPEPLANAMVQRLQRHLKKNGLWLIADFFIDKTQKNRHKWWKNILLQAMYTFFGWLCDLQTHTLPHLDRLFQQQLGQLIHTQYFYGHFIRSQVYCYTRQRM
ncbi:MAG: class I SAM-dependent methyltransferase [Bacteroidota bacterium]|nr:class I SAM-dependent methyltransferase [Bacteroidota bacterium]